MKQTRTKSTAFTLLMLSLTATLCPADISSVMKGTMKGDASLYKAVATGKGSPADATKLVGQLKQLQGQKPPKGEQASYDSKVAALVKAAEGVAAKNPGALQQLQTAGNCKACHSAHKED